MVRGRLDNKPFDMAGDIDPVTVSIANRLLFPKDSCNCGRRYSYGHRNNSHDAICPATGT